MARGRHTRRMPYHLDMHVRTLHDWDLSPSEAVALQRELAGRVVTDTPVSPESVKTVCGIDLSPPDPVTQLVRGAAVVLAWPSLEVVEVSTAEGIAPFPYVPGLLSFREAPILLEALSRLHAQPDLLLVDGQGTAHPRHFGVACHIGLAIDAPTIGCAKSRLTGAYDPPGQERGEWSPLISRGETIGAVVRTRTDVRPIFVSPGNNIDLESAIHWALACSPRYRIPVPTQLAHRAAAGAALL